MPVENSKGEAEAGQEELNIAIRRALDCADYHSIAKHAIKEIAWQQGHAATFLPKWHNERVGSSSHVHQSLWKDGKPRSLTPSATWHVRIDGHYMAGLIKYALITPIFWRPTSTATNVLPRARSRRQRPSGRSTIAPQAFRLCGEGTKASRVECRIGDQI